MSVPKRAHHAPVRGTAPSSSSAGGSAAGAHGAHGGLVDDIEALVDHMPCSRLYFALEECLGETDRDWVKCQPIVKALKQCSVKSTTPGTSN